MPIFQINTVSHWIDTYWLDLLSSYSSSSVDKSLVNYCQFVHAEWSQSEGCSGLLTVRAAARGCSKPVQSRERRVLWDPHTLLYVVIQVKERCHSGYRGHVKTMRTGQFSNPHFEQRRFVLAWPAKTPPKCTLCDVRFWARHRVRGRKRRVQMVVRH